MCWSLLKVQVYPGRDSIIRLLPVKMVDYDKYFIQVRESQPIVHVLIGIILLILAGFCIIGGLVFGILADQIFTP